MPKTCRAAVIASTREGGYGHGLDAALAAAPRVELVALADPDDAGRTAAGKRLGVARLYADYRQMLRREDLQLVSIAPRWVTDRVPMVRAAAAAGCHIYCEKPLAADLADADAMLAACDQAHVKLAVAHQFRAMPPLRQALAELRAGKYGRLVWMRARPKDDHRGGGEELVVHGTHLFDLMVHVAGPARWVSAHVAVGGRDATVEDAREGNEPVGPIAGDSIAATYGFAGGVRGFFDSKANLHRDGGPSLYGLWLQCERATLAIRSPGDVYVYPASRVAPDEDLAWKRTWVEDWHFTPEHKPRDLRDWLHRGNLVLVDELIAAIEHHKTPTASGADARNALEMIQGVYASHLAGGARVPLPLKERRHPLARTM